MHFIVVDFPDPLGPINPKISPFPTSKEILSTAFWVPYDFVSALTFNDIPVV
jgi:hypothetical protein